MDPDKEALLWQKADDLWEAEARPEGEHERHWQEAESKFLSSVDVELACPFQNGSTGLEEEEEQPSSACCKSLRSASLRPRTNEVGLILTKEDFCQDQSNLPATPAMWRAAGKDIALSPRPPNDRLKGNSGNAQDDQKGQPAIKNLRLVRSQIRLAT